MMNDFVEKNYILFKQKDTLQDLKLENSALYLYTINKT